MTPEGFKRKLAAILSADVKGYSRLMGEDEILQELGRLSGQVIREPASKDKLSEGVFESIMRFRKNASPW